MNSIINKLDLSNYINELKSYFARDKDIILQGDINIHYKIINELQNYTLKKPKEVENLDRALSYLSKQGVIKIYEIYEFIKIISYFLYLKKFNFQNSLEKWISKIIIPTQLEQLLDIFTSKGELQNGFNQELDNVNYYISQTKDAIKQKLYTIINSKNLQPYLVDHQIHLVYGEQTILVRGGFNHIIKGKILDRSSSGFFYI